jgi:hypothetical protein
MSGEENSGFVVACLHPRCELPIVGDGGGRFGALRGEIVAETEEKDGKGRSENDGTSRCGNH